MTNYEYRELQERFTAKLKNHQGYSTQKETAYNDGVLACKSILKDVFKHQQNREDEIYRELQERFTAKLKNFPGFAATGHGYANKKTTAYNEGVLACKSILKDVFKHQQNREEV